MGVCGYICLGGQAEALDSLTSYPDATWNNANNTFLIRELNINNDRWYCTAKRHYISF